MKQNARWVFAAFLFAGILFSWFSPALHAAEIQQDELQIGLPDFPRRIERTLPPLRPDQEIRLGVLKLHPSFSSSVEYDDNITLASKDEKEDMIFTQTPALGVELEMGKHRFQAGYGMEIVDFAKDQEENTINHLANGVLELNFNDLQIKLQDVLEKATNRSFSESSIRDNLITNSAEIDARYDRPRWAGEIGWRHNTLAHRTEELNVDDLGEDILAMLGGYKVLPKTLFLLETDLGRVTYRNTGNPNQGYWQVLTGFRGEPTEKFAVTAKMGFQDRQLGDVPNQGSQTDFRGLVVNSDLSYRLSENDSARLVYFRTPRLSTFGDNGWYRQDRISASYAKRFYRKWVVTPEFGWQFNDYPEVVRVGSISKRRQDDFWLGGISLRYEMREWVGAGVTYLFRHRNSNMNTFDFKNNRLTLDITLAY